MPKPNKARLEAKQAAQNQRSGLIDASKIAFGTISAVKIGTLDARWLASGTIPAHRIAPIDPEWVARLRKQYPELDKKENQE